MNTDQDKFAHARSNAKAWFQSIEGMLAELDRSQSGDNSHQDREDAETTIQESVLSVMVRDGWRSPGEIRSEDGPEEYEILLSTGGPALRIFGRLDGHCEPETAELQMQDWGTQWERYPAPEDALLTFARCFYFGE